MIYVVDIIVHFRTSYVNNMTGDEIFSPALIAIHYVTSISFYFDLVSSFPFDYWKIGTGRVANILSLVSMFKIARIARINRVISNLDIKQESKALLKVVYLIFLIFLVVHIFACFYWYIFILEYLWVPGLDFYRGYTNLWYENGTYKYFLLLYHSMLAFGRNDVVPRTTNELAFTSFYMIFCAMFEAFVFGTISTLVQSMRIKS